MVRTASKISIVFILILSAVSPTLFTTARAADQSVWSSGITLESDNFWVDEPGDYQCEQRQMSLQMFSSGGKYGDAAFSRFIPHNLLEPDTRDVCMIQNQHGVFGGNYWSPHSNPNDALEIVNANVIPVPASNVVLISNQYGSDPYGSSRISINYNLPAIGKLNTGIRGRGNSAKVYKRWRVTSQANLLAYADGSPMVVRSWGFSSNGRFAVVVLTSGHMFRINLHTQEITPFTKRSPNAKSWQLAISNDGNYALSYDSNAAALRFHDLFGCKKSYDRGQYSVENTNPPNESSPQGCTSEDIQSKIYHLYPGAVTGSLGRLSFEHGSSGFRVGAGWREGNSNIWRKLKFKPVNYTNTAEGYLAMGDSFTSGEGDTQGGLWYEPGTDEQGDINTFAGRNLCHLSRRSYPYLMALELGYLSNNSSTPPADGLFHSVACSGAKIHNITGILGEKQNNGGAAEFAFTDNQYRYDDTIGLRSWQPGATRQSNFIQKSYLTDGTPRIDIDPEVITIGIGGNDAGFGDFLSSCLLPGTCEYAVSGSDAMTNLAAKIASNKPRLVSAYQQIKNAAPNSRIYVHGYPDFIEGSGGNCAVNVRLNDSERFFVEKAVHYMNRVIQSAAITAGVYYIDVEDILVGHKLCSETDKIFVNGVTAGNDIETPWFVDALSAGVCYLRTGCLGNETYHPSPPGFKLYKDTILASTNNLKALMPEPVAADVPVPDVFFGGSAIDIVNKINNNDEYPNLSIEDDAIITRANMLDRTVTLSRGGLLPRSPATIEIHSTPQVIGNILVGDSGDISMTVSLPEYLEPGYHEIHIIGTDVFGNPVDYYQTMIIGSSTTDFDDDGVLNDEDSCPIIHNSFIDEDEDGIDDACDTFTALEDQQPSETEENLPKGTPSNETVAGSNEPTQGAVLGATTEVLGQESLQNTGDNKVAINLLVGALLFAASAIVYMKKPEV